MIIRSWLTAGLLLWTTPGAALAETVARDDAKLLADAQKLHQQVEKMSHDNSEAAMEFAALVEQGDFGILPDRAAALDIYEKAAAGGQRIARAKMCRAYLLGDGRPKDLVKAAPYCNSLGSEDATGLFWAAYDFENGVSGPKDEAQAMDLYAVSASSGSGDAAATLGRKALSEGKPDSARAWFRRGAYLGSADAMDLLAQLLESGQGGPADAIEASWLYCNAATLGNADAAAKTKARPDVPQMAYRTKDRSLELVRTYTTEKGPRIEKLTVQSLTELLAKVYPGARDEHMSEASVHVECYVGADRKIDACVLQHEFPVGFGFGDQIKRAFDGRLQFPDKDLKGEPTAGHVFSMTFRWQIG